jgi:hypothetical protein
MYQTDCCSGLTAYKTAGSIVLPPPELDYDKFQAETEKFLGKIYDETDKLLKAVLKDIFGKGDGESLKTLWSKIPQTDDGYCNWIFTEKYPIAGM